MYIECAELTVTIQEESNWSMRSEVKKTLQVKGWDLFLSQFGSERSHV